MKHCFSALCLILIPATFAVRAQAQVVWNFGTATGTASPTSGILSNLTAGAVTQNNNFGSTTMLSNSSASTTYSGASGNYNAAASAVAGAFNVSSSTYFEFTLTPSSDYQVSVTAVSFGTRSTASGATTVALRSSSDSYGTALASGSSNTTWALVSVSSLTSITGTATSPLTFRIYGYGGTGSSGTANWRTDDISVTASVTAIPEPSTYAAIFGVAALGFAAWQRRRQQRKTSVLTPSG